MATGPTKTVFFFDPGVIIGQDPVSDCPDGFWKRLHETVAAKGADDRKMEYRGRKYWGRAGTGLTPAIPYMYLGRARSPADWPDFANAKEELGQLPVDHEGTHLVEPAYLTPVSGTNFIAMIRTSGGPSTTAIEHWINAMMGSIGTNRTIVLRPYMRGDAWTRLAAAQGATKLHTKFDPQALMGGAPSSNIDRAMQDIQASLGGAVSLELTLSFGHATPDGATSEALVRAIREILQNRNPSQADATLMLPDEEGDLTREPVDFMKDRYTTRVEVGGADDVPVTGEIMLTALRDGIANFRRDLH